MTQALPQSVNAGFVQTHIPPRHTVPAGQWLPHEPQFCESPIKLAQTLPQSVYPLLHCTLQTPLLHVTVELGGAVHFWPQLPQLFGSVPRFTQALPQRLSPAGQTQEPKLHPAPAGQTFPQPPQFVGSVKISTQTAEHVVTPRRVWQAHWPPTQAPGGAQSLPQPPQLPGSTLTFVQAPPQHWHSEGSPHWLEVVHGPKMHVAAADGFKAPPPFGWTMFARERGRVA